MWIPEVDADRQGGFWLLEHVRNGCAREGIEIPVPFRTIVRENGLPPTRDASAVDDPGTSESGKSLAVAGGCRAGAREPARASGLHTRRTAVT